jgi:hypothetical protein
MKKIIGLFVVTLCMSSVLFAQSDSLQAYTGKYKFPEGSPFTEVNVSIIGGVLTASSSLGSSELRHIVSDSFDVVAYGGLAVFKRNGENKVTGVHIMVSDIDIEGTKVEEAPIDNRLRLEIYRRK